MAEVVEVRCPVGPKRLFTKLRLAGEEPFFTEDNLIEFACSDCKKAMIQAQPRLIRVLHQYNFFGELVNTFSVLGSDDSESPRGR